jgi:NAD(P)-dependent dehydrogenase (short-subunit alcohol dehydrogenase family)
VVIVSSHSHYSAQGIDFEAVRRPTASFSGLHEYNVSKLANVLFSKELARRLAGSGVTTYALHPGTVASDVWRSAWRPARPLLSLMKRFMLSNEEGARTTLHCATAPELANETGLYYSRCRAKHPSRLAQDPSLAAKLWEKSAEWTSLTADLKAGSRHHDAKG